MITREGLAAMRFGYGPFAGRLPPLPDAARLAGPDLAARNIPGTGAMAAMAAQRAVVQARKAAEGGDKAALEEFRRLRRATVLAHLEALRRDLARAVSGEDPFRERLVRFWADHFTVRARTDPARPLVSAFVDEAIRPHVGGRFADMLRASSYHPGMLIYLDQTASVGPASRVGQRRGLGLNENLAREILELHTLGVGADYSQNDVRQFAKLLTGLVADPEEGVRFMPERAEPGAETVLGRSYGGARRARVEDIDAVLEDLAVHPATARHVAGKIAVHFVSDSPDPGLVDDLAAVWADTGGDLSAVSGALLDHPATWAAPMEKLRQPQDFLIAALRALGIGADRILALEPAMLQRHLLRPLALMGQPWQAPNGPDGWPEEAAAWVTPQGLAARIDWAMQVPGRLSRPLPDPRDFVDMALAGIAGDELRRAVARAENTPEGVGLVLAAPAFNRR